jgi:hypothetical protein
MLDTPGDGRVAEWPRPVRPRALRRRDAGRPDLRQPIQSFADADAFVPHPGGAPTNVAVSAGLPHNDFPLVLDGRAGPYVYLDSFRKGHPQAYEAAVAAFGTPSTFHADGNLCRVTWSAAGITVGFASELSPCAAAHLYESAWYGMTLTDLRWHNRVGFRVGMSIAEVRSLYPGLDPGTVAQGDTIQL